MATALTAAGIQFPDDTVTSTNLLPSGTRLLFHNSSAPTGWTKDTTINDSALRVVSGTPGSGGSAGFASALGSPSVSGSVSLSGEPGTGNLATSITGNVNIGSTTLSTSQMPSHSHGHRIMGRTNSGAGFANNANKNVVNRNAGIGNNTDAVGMLDETTNSVGGSGSHTHNVGSNLSASITGSPDKGTLSAAISSASASINVKYQDFILAQKD